MKKQRKATGKAKRGFYVLDHEKALDTGIKAMAVLRAIAKAKPAAVSLGLSGALHVLEEVLNGMLRFSSGALPDGLFAGFVPEPIPEDLGRLRKVARGAVNVLRMILKDARTDLSVSESECTVLDCAIDDIEDKLNDLLPPPGAPARGRLPFDDDGEPTPQLRTGAPRKTWQCPCLHS